MKANNTSSTISAILLASLSLFAVSSKAYSDPAPTPLPVCVDCHVLGDLVRQKSVPDSECAAASDKFTRRYYEGNCRKWECSNGYYYVWSGYYDTQICTDKVLNDPDGCPAPTCKKV